MNMQSVKTWFAENHIHLLYMVVAIFIAVWLYNKPVAAPVGVAVVATKAPEVVATPTVSVPIKAPVKVYAGGKALKQKLSLPQPQVQNDDVKVLASSKVVADDHPHTLTTTINPETGETQTFDRRDPLPWLAWDYRGELGVYGVEKFSQNAMEPAIRIEAKQSLFQVKIIHFGGMASADIPLGAGKPEAVVGFGGWGTW